MVMFSARITATHSGTSWRDEIDFQELPCGDTIASSVTFGLIPKRLNESFFITIIEVPRLIEAATTYRGYIKRTTSSQYGQCGCLVDNERVARFGVARR